MKKSRRIKFPFTLLEIVVCMAILTLVSGVVGLKIKQGIDRHEFESSFNRLVYELKEIQMLTLSYRAEFGLTVEATEKGFQYQFFTDEPHFTKKLKAHELKGMDSLSFDQEKAEKVTLALLADGRVLPQGKLTFHHLDEMKVLDLTTPLQIKSTTRYSDP